MIRDHGVAAGAHLGCDTKAQLPMLTWPARSRARPAREYTRKKGPQKDEKPRTKGGGWGAVVSKRLADRPPSVSLAHLRRHGPASCRHTEADAAANFVEAAYAAAATAPSPSPCSRARVLRASVVDRPACVVISLSRLESMSHYYHICIVVAITSSESPLSRPTIAGSDRGSGVSGTSGRRADKHAHFSPSLAVKDTS